MLFRSLSRRPDLDPGLALLSLPVQGKANLAPCCQRILEQQPEWIALILPILSERLIGLTTAEIMATLGISNQFWRHTRAFQEILQEGRSREACDLAGRLLERRFGPLTPALFARVEALSLPELEELSLALLEFQTLEDLSRWLDE